MTTYPYFRIVAAEEKGLDLGSDIGLSTFGLCCLPHCNLIARFRGGIRFVRVEGVKS